MEFILNNINNIFIPKYHNGLDYPKYKLIDKMIDEPRQLLIKLNIYKINKTYAYELLNILHKLFKKKNIFFWLSGGTALGFYRNNDFIDHDDDIDISLFYSSKDKFVKYVLPKLINNGFIIRHIDIDRTRTKNGVHAFMSLRYKNITLDIDFIGLGYTSATGNNCDSKIILPYLKEFKQVLINNKIFNIPLESYYIFLYGTDYMIPIKNKKPII